MSKKLHGVVLGFLVLALAAGTPPAYALFGSIKKKANSAKNTATSTASSVKNTATQTASKAANSDASKNAQRRLTRADQQASSMVGQLSDTFSQITE